MKSKYDLRMRSSRVARYLGAAAMSLALSYSGCGKDKNKKLHPHSPTSQTAEEIATPFYKSEDDEDESRDQTQELPNPAPAVQNSSEETPTRESFGNREIDYLIGEARKHYDTGRYANALLSARSGLRELEKIVSCLEEEEGATLRGRAYEIFNIGANSAEKLEDYEEILFFMESGRAGSLLETLGGGKEILSAEIPKELLEFQKEARKAAREAWLNYTEIRTSGDLRKSKAARDSLESVLEKVKNISAEIQRKSKRAANLFYPQAATLEEIQSNLRNGEMFVSYGLYFPNSLALLITPDNINLVNLGSSEEIEKANRKLDIENEKKDSFSSIEKLRRLLATPLLLDSEIDRILVSPEGSLSYVPFGMLFENQQIAYLPSGTTHSFLRRENSKRGSKVLAVGNPDYSKSLGTRLALLPETKREVEAIGDVVLTEDRASEEEFRNSLKIQNRWKAVHLACHGILNGKNPLLSSLALTPSGEDDGFLTAFEVFRTEIPTDIAVLSACDTARGKIYGAEGVVGLRRSFMYAGATRVLCPLWKVDDEATKSLMKKFYELWNPENGEGIEAADALKKAQEFVRTNKEHPRWSHPSYWAAWQLWGLP